MGVLFVRGLGSDAPRPVPIQLDWIRQRCLDFYFSKYVVFLWWVYSVSTHCAFHEQSALKRTNIRTWIMKNFERIERNEHSDPLYLILVWNHNVKERPFWYAHVWQILSQVMRRFVTIRSCLACCILLLKKCLSGTAPCKTSMGVSPYKTPHGILL